MLSNLNEIDIVRSYLHDSVINVHLCPISFNLSPHVMYDQPDKILGSTTCPQVTCDMLKIFVKRLIIEVAGYSTSVPQQTTGVLC